MLGKEGGRRKIVYRAGLTINFLSDGQRILDGVFQLTFVLVIIYAYTECPHPCALGQCVLVASCLDLDLPPHVEIQALLVHLQQIPVSQMLSDNTKSKIKNKWIRAR